MDTQTTTIYTAIVITSITLGIIILFFVLSIIRQQRRNIALQKQNILAEISAMESERARIAADLHDDLGPVLSAIKFQVDNTTAVDATNQEQLSKASRYMDGMIQRMREIANNLMPSALLRKGLSTAIEEFTSNIAQASTLKIRYTYKSIPDIPQEKSINIYRIIQEVVHNCVKHAKATELQIHIEPKQKHLSVLCRDNGVGFDKRLFVESEGIGLRSLKRRTELLGGTVDVESKPGVGTAYLFEIPLN